MRSLVLKLLLLLLVLFVCGCASKSAGSAQMSGVGREGYAIQVGAFKDVNNAARFVDTMNDRGFDAFLFKEDGLYKVRFGNYSSRDEARSKGRSLRKSGRIGEFFVVVPEDYAVYKSKSRKDSNGYLRNELVKATHRYIGVPYVWGGTSAKGFDCSGLTRAVYRLNGLHIPRVSRDQFRAGKAIKKSQLKKGDLVFFATTGKKRVSHVGVYIGNNIFIHSPRKGATVRKDRLDNKYWSKVYMGARTYL